MFKYEDFGTALYTEADTEKIEIVFVSNIDMTVGVLVFDEKELSKDDKSFQEGSSLIQQHSFFGMTPILKIVLMEIKGEL